MKLLAHTFVDGKAVSTREIDDPFHRTVVTTTFGTRDLLKMLLRLEPRKIRISVIVEGDRPALDRWYGAGRRPMTDGEIAGFIANRSRLKR